MTVFQGITAPCPSRVIERGYTLLGTAHVSAESAAEVRERIRSGA